MEFYISIELMHRNNIMTYFSFFDNTECNKGHVTNPHMPSCHCSTVSMLVFKPQKCNYVFVFNLALGNLLVFLSVLLNVSASKQH